MQYKIKVLYPTSNAEYNNQSFVETLIADGYQITGGAYSFYKKDGNDQNIIASYPVGLTIIESIEKS